jgi:hypothetical protein
MLLQSFHKLRGTRDPEKFHIPNEVLIFRKRFTTHMIKNYINLFTQNVYYTVFVCNVNI